MRLWVESAQQSLGPSAPRNAVQWAAKSQGDAGDLTPGNLVSTLRTEEQFAALVACRFPGSEGSVQAADVGSRAWGAASELTEGAAYEKMVAGLLSALPADEHAPLALLHVGPGDPQGRATLARLVECDAPPLFMARQGRVVLLPVVEEEVGSHLIRRCEFELRDGDHLAMVTEGYIQGIKTGKTGPFVGWREVAVAIRRLTETRCSAEQLAGALVRQYQRMAGSEAESPARVESAIRNPQSAIAVLAMFVRPMRSMTIWTGPPASRAAERSMLDALMAEEDIRAVCGDTTAEIAARLLGAHLVMEPRPAEGWAEVPPVSRMVLPDGNEAVTLVTEGVVTMRVARQRLAEAPPQNRTGGVQARDLMGRADGASRLASLLLIADKVRFLVGMAVNPAQVTADGKPLRRTAVEEMVADLKERRKIESVEYF
jgi:hypothetical protein